MNKLFIEIEELLERFYDNSVNADSDEERKEILHTYAKIIYEDFCS